MRLRCVLPLAALTTVAAVPPATHTAIRAAADNAVLRLVQTIPLPAVEGRIDHLDVDVQGQRLFVSALGNNTLEVLDLAAGKRLRSITGLKEPQGVYYVPALNRIFVANGDDGTCRIFDGSSYNQLDTVNYASDADNCRYDAAQKQIYVGYGEGALGILDAATGHKLADIKLPAHPESFRLEESGPRVFVNLPEAGHTIVVVDRVRRAVVATWMLEAAANFPMILDEPDHRLLVVTRRPALLTALDTESGRTVASYSTVGDADDAFFDARHRRIYVSGGEGFIDVFEQRDPDHYQSAGRIATAAGARTSVFVPKLNRLYVAVPHRGRQGAEVRVYEAGP
jgi:DNA-binding beta-propeller fold protein YncE